jgi:hypothetical protein
MIIDGEACIQDAIGVKGTMEVWIDLEENN